MPHTDRLGLPLTTSSNAAAAAYRAGVDLLLATWTGAAEEFDAAIAADPEFALAHAARARLHFIRAEGPAAKAAIARAVACAALNATERGTQPRCHPRAHHERAIGASPVPCMRPPRPLAARFRDLVAALGRVWSLRLLRDVRPRSSPRRSVRAPRQRLRR